MASYYYDKYSVGTYWTGVYKTGEIDTISQPCKESVTSEPNIVGGNKNDERLTFKYILPLGRYKDINGNVAFYDPDAYYVKEIVQNPYEGLGCYWRESSRELYDGTVTSYDKSSGDYTFTANKTYMLYQLSGDIFQYYLNKKGAFVGTIIAEDGVYPIDGRHSDGFWYIRQGLAFPEMKIRVDGTLKTSVDGWVKVNGTLKHIDSMWTKVDGVLKQI